MEDINKIYAVTLDRSQSGYGPGGNCKVVSIIRKGKYITNEEEILSLFQTDGKIFSNKIFEFVTDLDINELIEIIPSYVNTDVDENRNFYVSLQSVRRCGIPVIDIPSDYLELDYIDLENISEYIRNKNLFSQKYNQIYICDHDSIYGPFRIENNLIKPIQGRHTNSFTYDINELIEDENLKNVFLITEPKSKIQQVDCSTPSQLVDFLKDRLQIERVDLNLLTKIGSQISELNKGSLELDTIRLKRASNYIGQLSMSFKELLKVLNIEDSWQLEIGNIVSSYADEFKNYALSDIGNLIKEKELELEKVKSDLEAKHQEAELKRVLLDQQQEELDRITKNKNDLILNIQLLAGLETNNSFNNKTNTEVSYEVLKLDNLSKFINVDDYYDYLESEYNLKIKNSSVYGDGLILLKENSFLLAKDMTYVLNLIHHLANVEVYIQNAEIDWVKFSFWKDNGLEEIIRKADNNKEHSYIYILQDFNIASFECYGKPILDIVNKCRRSLLTEMDTFPSNLKIILIQTDEEIDDFGFQLNQSTFKNWKFLPNAADVSKINFPICDGIDLTNFEVDRSVNDYSQFYI